MKSYTDLSQSQKLAEILPLESADMCYPLPCEDGDKPLLEQGGFGSTPCWSLSALLNTLPTLDGRNAVLCKDIRYDEWHICYHSTATLSVIDTERYNNPVDACYEMIIRLNELNLL